MNLPTIHTQIKGKALNMVTGEPIKNAASGEFETGKMMYGKFILEATAEDFEKEKQDPVEVKRGHITHVDFKLVPAA